MEGIPPGIDYDSVKDTLLSVRGVKDTHSLHIWALTMSQHQMSVHALIDEQTDPHTALKDMTNLLQTEFSFHNITIQIEAYSDEMAYCNECQDAMD
ncbi:hypothetical protein PDJAM_G00016200 [Pangasius djambal]|uniref:Uncharacterized protein n=1 Tax=Pangasius djambal TaxID=1691987 RepID=A0ACC5YM28_9TELE|nr:hypothetical protein [Pangasius djambal]